MRELCTRNGRVCDRKTRQIGCGRQGRVKKGEKRDYGREGSEHACQEWKGVGGKGKDVRGRQQRLCSSWERVC